MWKEYIKINLKRNYTFITYIYIAKKIEKKRKENINYYKNEEKVYINYFLRIIFFLK